MKNLVEMFPMDEIAEFCQRWKIQEMAVFGSVLRADFDSESDIDVNASRAAQPALAPDAAEPQR